MKDSREYHELTWALLLLIAVEVVEGDVSRGLATFALLVLLTRMTQRDVRRWRRRREELRDDRLRRDRAIARGRGDR